MTVWDDGAGAALYVGGQFKLAGGVVANSIAKWNGHRLVGPRQGHPRLAIGVPGHVYALAGYQGKLYVGGYYYGAGDSDTGRASSAVGAGRAAGRTRRPTASTVRFGTGGLQRQAVRRRRMHQIGLTATEHIACYDGTIGRPWEPVLSVAGRGPDVWNDGTGSALYAGGDFTSAGGVPAPSIAKWNGTAWSAVGGGVSNPSGPRRVSALTPYDDGTGRAWPSAARLSWRAAFPPPTSPIIRRQLVGHWRGPGRQSQGYNCLRRRWRRAWPTQPLCRRRFRLRRRFRREPGRVCSHRPLV